MIFTNLEFNFSCRQSYIIFLPSVDSTIHEEHIVCSIGRIPSGTESSIRTTCYCVGMLNRDKTIHGDVVLSSTIGHDSLEGESTITIVGVGSVTCCSEVSIWVGDRTVVVTFTSARVCTETLGSTTLPQADSEVALTSCTCKNDVLSHFRNCGILYSNNGSCWSIFRKNSNLTILHLRTSVVFC